MRRARPVIFCVVCLSFFAVSVALAGIIVGPFDISEKAKCKNVPPQPPTYSGSTVVTTVPPYVVMYNEIEKHSWPDDQCGPCGCVEDQCSHKCTLGNVIGPATYTITKSMAYHFLGYDPTTNQPIPGALILGPTFVTNVTKNSRRVC